MATYYTIHDMSHPNSQSKRLVAICFAKEQAGECFRRILKNGYGMTYVILERVETNEVGLIIGRSVLDESPVEGQY